MARSPSPAFLLRKYRYLGALTRRHANRQPIVLFTFGKVGSTAVLRALEAAGESVLHTHAISSRAVADAEAPYRRDPTAGFPFNAWRGQFTRWHWKLPTSRPRKIVTLVRDPVARNVSAFFQVASAYGLVDFDDPSSLATAPVIESFLHEFTEHRGPIDWYQGEFRRATGLNVFDIEPPVGQASFHEDDRGQLTILRAEDLRGERGSDLIERVLATNRSGLTPSSIEVKATNVTATKPVAELYERFLDEIRLPTDYLNMMYESDFAQHFYTQDELASFRLKWSHPGNTQPGTD